MNITIDLIKSYKPCQKGIDNFESKYPNYNDSLVNLLSLDDISYSDKVWLACRVVDTKILQQWSVECAEQVVDNYNSVYPNDTRIIDCIEMTTKYLLEECSLNELQAAESAARSARSAARSARSAARSAESAARSARSAARSARSAARSARSAESAESAESEQEDINLSILIALIENWE